ncbi:hypothetical protein [Actinoplanes lobatus]|nr:hypothetical protein [Actinoplanes lobatus]
MGDGVPDAVEPGSGLLDELVSSVALVASLAVAEGANVKAVQRMLGHASAAMTLDVYADLFEDDLDAVADRLDQAVTGRSADYLRTDHAGPAFDAVRPPAKKQVGKVGRAGLEPATEGL